MWKIPKDPVLRKQRTNVIYSVQCDDFDHEYTSYQLFEGWIVLSTE